MRPATTSFVELAISVTGVVIGIAWIAAIGLIFVQGSAEIATLLIVITLFVLLVALANNRES